MTWLCSWKLTVETLETPETLLLARFAPNSAKREFNLRKPLWSHPSRDATLCRIIRYTVLIRATQRGVDISRWRRERELYKLHRWIWTAIFHVLIRLLFHWHFSPFFQPTFRFRIRLPTGGRKEIRKEMCRLQLGRSIREKTNNTSSQGASCRSFNSPTEGVKFEKHF